MRTQRTRMVWPLTRLGTIMTPDRLLAELYEAINLANGIPEWPLLILPPKPDDIEISREDMTISAVCEYVRKSDLRKEQQP